MNVAVLFLKHSPRLGHFALSQTVLRFSALSMGVRPFIEEKSKFFLSHSGLVLIFISFYRFFCDEYILTPALSYIKGKEQRKFSIINGNLTKILVKFTFFP